MTNPSIDHIVSKDFEKAEFRKRCQRVASAVGPNASALLQGAPRPPSAHPVFAQSKVFYYMSGIQIERSYLLIDGDTAEITLFVPSEGICNVKGGAIDQELAAEICKQSVIDEIRTIDELESRLASVSTLYLLQRPDEVIFGSKFALMGAARLRAEDPFDGAKRRDELLLETIQSKFPKIEIGELDPIIATMRLIKSPAEINILSKNGHMSAKVCMECMKATKPGIPAGALHGIADYVFRITGNCGHAYNFIMEPSHPDSKTLQDGDLVLVDCAPDNGYYAMDIARIWPVNGTFDEWQRHTYGLIVDYHKILLSMLKPGVMVADLYKDAEVNMLSKYKGDQAGLAILDNMITRGVRYYNHHVGLAMHDAVDLTWNGRPLEAGMVMVVDPMVWLDDAPHDYVRVEDTVVITENGCESLTGAVPFEIDEIEEVMKKPGQFPTDLTL